MSAVSPWALANFAADGITWSDSSPGFAIYGFGNAHTWDPATEVTLFDVFANGGTDIFFDASLVGRSASGTLASAADLAGIMAGTPGIVANGTVTQIYVVKIGAPTNFNIACCITITPTAVTTSDSLGVVWSAGRVFDTAGSGTVFIPTLTGGSSGGGGDTLPVAAFTETPPAGAPPLAVVFDPSGSTEGSFPISTYHFDYGDGGSDTITSGTASHTYAAAGIYTVTLTVTDSGSQTSTVHHTVAVITPAAPFANQRVTAALVVPGVSVTDLLQPFGISWKDPRTDVGSAEISLPYGDAQTALMLPNRWVDMLVTDGTGTLDVLSMIIETIVDGQVDPGLQGALAYKCSGRNHIAEWERNLLAPEEGVPADSSDTVRYFNFSSRYLDDSAWTTSVIPYSIPGMFSAPWRYPKNWPDPFSSWTWSREWDGGLYPGPGPLLPPPGFSTPVGTSYVRKHITLGSADNLIIYAVADDFFDLWFDNDLVLQGVPSSTGNYAQAYQRVEVAGAGDHIISAKITNGDPGFTDGNIAGIAISVFALTGLTEHIGGDNSLTHTGLVGEPGSLVNDGFVWLDYPAAPPGFTPGKMVRIWRDEFEARGGPSWTLDFSDTIDSAGNAWAIQPEYAFNIGMDGLSMLRQIGQTDVDWYAVPGERTLRMWNKGGRGVTQAAVLSRASNILTATYTTEV